MKRELLSRWKFVSLLFVITAGLLCVLIGTNSCGIYTASGVLNPPFGQQTRTDSLIFYGYNTESYFLGYILWYKEAGTDSYKICSYKNKFELPTILNIDEMDPGWVEHNDLRSDPDNPRVEYKVYIQDLRPLDSPKNFVELNNDNGQRFYFGVSSYGKDGQESDLIEFGIWPAS